MKNTEKVKTDLDVARRSELVKEQETIFFVRAEREADVEAIHAFVALQLGK